MIYGYFVKWYIFIVLLSLHFTLRTPTNMAPYSVAFVPHQILTSIWLLQQTLLLLIYCWATSGYGELLLLVFRNHWGWYTNYIFSAVTCTSFNNFQSFVWTRSKLALCSVWLAFKTNRKRNQTGLRPCKGNRTLTIGYQRHNRHTGHVEGNETPFYRLTMGPWVSIDLVTFHTRPLPWSVNLTKTIPSVFNSRSNSLTPLIKICQCLNSLYISANCSDIKHSQLFTQQIVNWQPDLHTGHMGSKAPSNIKKEPPAYWWHTTIIMYYIWKQ